jgi:hypothetical protein
MPLILSSCPAFLAVPLVILFAEICPAGEIEDQAARFEPAFADAEPENVVHDWYLPFDTRDRSSLSTIRLVSSFGAKRLSYKRGHIHTATDMVPRRHRRGAIEVFPVAVGVVCSIHLAAPHTTVVLKHRLPDGRLMFTSYKHLAEVFVETGQEVNHQTPLGRLFTRAQARKLGGNYDHLHLEIRKLFDDFGTASWLTMTRAELDKRFLDPMKFLRERLRPPRGLSAKTAHRFISAARELLGVNYDFGGRLRTVEEGIDCQGLVFYAAERIGRCGWKSFSTLPTVSVVKAELGVRVPGMDPVAAENLDISRLLPGDVIMEVDPIENEAEPSIGSLNSEPVWVWHVGLYSGAGNWINANAFEGRVVEENLRDYLAEHAVGGIFVTRMSHKPSATRCRHNRRMRLVQGRERPEKANAK